MVTKPRASVPLVLSAVLFAGNLCHGEDWPQWLGAKRDGSTTEKVATWEADSPPKQLWKVAVGNGFASPVVAGGKAYVHARTTDAGTEEEVVTAFDAATGNVVWSESYARPRYFSVLGSGPRGTPTVAGKTVYAIGINGVISAFDADSGKRKWQLNLYEHFKAELPRFGVCSSPLVVGNRVVVSVGGKGRCIVALNTESGAVEWQALDDAASTSSAVLFSAGQRAAGAPPDVVFMTPLRLLGLDPLDGSLRWEHPMVFQPQGTSPTPIALGDMLVASTQAHGAVAVKVKTTDSGYTADAGWQRAEAKSYFSSGVAGPDLLFLVTNVVEMLPVANLTCLDAKTGKELWVKEKIGYFHAALTKLGDGKLLVLSDGGTLSLLEVNAKGAKELCKTKACGGTLVAPALANGKLYCRDGGELVCLELPQPK